MILSLPRRHSEASLFSILFLLQITRRQNVKGRKENTFCLSQWYTGNTVWECSEGVELSWLLCPFWKRTHCYLSFQKGKKQQVSTSLTMSSPLSGHRLSCETRRHKQYCASNTEGKKRLSPQNLTFPPKSVCCNSGLLWLHPKADIICHTFSSFRSFSFFLSLISAYCWFYLAAMIFTCKCRCVCGDDNTSSWHDKTRKEQTSERDNEIVSVSDSTLTCVMSPSLTVSCKEQKQQPSRKSFSGKSLWHPVVSVSSCSLMSTMVHLQTFNMEERDMASRWICMQIAVGKEMRTRWIKFCEKRQLLKRKKGDDDRNRDKRDGVSA